MLLKRYLSFTTTRISIQRFKLDIRLWQKKLSKISLCSRKSGLRLDSSQSLDICGIRKVGCKISQSVLHNYAVNENELYILRIPLFLELTIRTLSGNASLCMRCSYCLCNFLICLLKTDLYGANQFIGLNFIYWHI